MSSSHFSKLSIMSPSCLSVCLSVCLYLSPGCQGYTVKSRISTVVINGRSMDLCLSSGFFTSLVFGRVMMLDAFNFSIIKFVCTTPDSEWLADCLPNLNLQV